MSSGVATFSTGARPWAAWEKPMASPRLRTNQFESSCTWGRFAVKAKPTESRKYMA